MMPADPLLPSLRTSCSAAMAVSPQVEHAMTSLVTRADDILDLHSLSQIEEIERPTDVPDTGLLCDLLWSDPDKDVEHWGENDRGQCAT